MKHSNYDTWKTNKPEEGVEVYEADIPVYFGTNEITLNKFRAEVERLAKEYGLEDDMDNL